MIVSLALSPSLDTTYDVGVLRRGEITRPDVVTRVAGGKALNFARVAHELGAEVRVVAALGGRTGEWIQELLAADGVEADAVRLATPTRICSAIVEAGESPTSTDLYEPATPLSQHEWEQFARVARGACRGAATWVVLAGSFPVGVHPEEVGALVDALRTEGVRFALDSSGEALRTLADRADLLKVNLSEARELLGADALDARAAARSIVSLHGGDAVVTDGVRGGFAVIGGAECRIERPRVRGRYPAGSGDAFFGGLLAGLHQGSDPIRALAIARDAAERNALVPGQGILGRERKA